MKTLLTLLLVPIWANSQQNTLQSPDKLFGATIHWNSQSAVKNQGQRNTCSAFGVAAALETFDGVPKDLSEKYLYGIQKANDFVNGKQTTQGQFLAYYPNALLNDGAIKESQLPYDPNATQKWQETDSELTKSLFEGGIGYMTLSLKYKKKAKVFLKDYEYLDFKASKNTDYLKFLLKNGIKAIPVSYELYVPAWNAYTSRNFNTITPDPGYSVISLTGQEMPFSALQKLSSTDLADQIINGEVKIIRNDRLPNQYAGHVVTIIGYDDQGFIIKNSWGINWRWSGYERVSFDFHKLFAYEALVIKSVRFK